MGEMTNSDGVWTPIMYLPIMFHGDVGETRDTYGPDLGMETLSRSPSSRIIWRRSLCGRLGGRAEDDGGCPPCWCPLGGEVGRTSALNLKRVGACADELRLMGVERAEVPTIVGRAGGVGVPSPGKCREPVGLLI